MNENKWTSKIPTNCEVCGLPMGEFFIDGSVDGGAWALMCEECHTIKGAGLGIGRGQRYITSSGNGVDGFNE
jgi:hypothetical protein